MKGQGIKYIFSGEGADEIFGGYQHHKQAFKTGQTNRPNVIQSFGEYQFDAILNDEATQNVGRVLNQQAQSRSDN